LLMGMPPDVTMREFQQVFKQKAAFHKVRAASQHACELIDRIIAQMKKQSGGTRSPARAATRSSSNCWRNTKRLAAGSASCGVMRLPYPQTSMCPQGGL
jgi:hypothetical protein